MDAGQEDQRGSPVSFHRAENKSRLSFLHMFFSCFPSRALLRFVPRKAEGMVEKPRPKHSVSHLPQGHRSDKMAQFILDFPGDLGEGRRSLSAKPGSFNAQKSLTCRLKGFLRIMQPSPLTTEMGNLGPRGLSQGPHCISQRAAELRLTADLLLPSSANLPVPHVVCVPILPMKKLRA